jgi:L-alanine-DL-glutamate epimerase-like enolase superfamily enzyme
MKLILQRCDLHLINLRTRMPFKYGIATMTRMPMIFVRAHATIDGQPVTGVSSDLLPPKWFTKDPAKPVGDEITDMLEVIRSAAQLAQGMEAASPFALWRQLYDAQRHSDAGRKHPPLLAHFGTSLVERALLEAACRHTGEPFHRLLQTNRLGIDLGAVHAPLRGIEPGGLLPDRPLGTIIARHTVGLSDPLTDADVPAEERLDDGLPQSLEACIRAYGLRHFKLKVNGRLEQDLDRLQRIARLLETHAPRDYAFTIDGNEQFKSLADFHIFWETVSHSDRLRDFLSHLLFIEQPLHRDVALSDAVGEDFAKWSSRPPIIIDESDGTLESLPRALALGYDGTSHKNCKGVFKGVINRCLLLQRARQAGNRPVVMSGEDLCNVGPVALLQDLAVCAALGIESVERNGHHYNAGLSQLPAPVQSQTLAAHGDLYHAAAAGWPTLTIQDGRLRVESLNRAPFGVGFALDVTQFTPADRFEPEV